ncbi:MarR family winged helix-turn-helix transcriptional regulator [Ferviditalea candida]|uniref:MarR family transcriptional regulator n=1 Tax=Ferviditalea candida TaxID=3108399 RepID=A0ABU5ZGV3_9BACL|nr:MarR family transcriptional regulator [Paenibacillaceae bacterium T2]
MDTEDIKLKIAELDNLFATIAVNNRWPAVDSLSKQQIMLMKTLYSNGKITMSELAKHLNLTKGATTIAIDRLVAAKMVNRTRDEADRRIVWIELSGKGSEIISKVKQKRDQLLSDMFSNLTTAEIEQFISLLRKMMENLKPR